MGPMLNPLYRPAATISIPIAFNVTGFSYKDTGCQFAPACLNCPFSICYHDDPITFNQEFKNRHKATVTRLDREIRLRV